MLTEQFTAEQFKLRFTREDVVSEIPSFETRELEQLGYDVDIESQNERGMSMFCKPPSVELPFIKYTETETPDGTIKNFTVGWTKEDEEGNVPKGLSSKTAQRKDKPAIISGRYMEDGDLQFSEVLYAMDGQFERYVFNEKNASVSEYWFYLESKDEHAKIYDMKKPFYVNYFTDGSPKEVWFCNPKANSFVETNCTLRHTDDQPVVISFYPNGDLEKVDYTGYVFSNKQVPHVVNNFPFHSRYRFYLPSFFHYSKKNEYGFQRLIESAYFIRKDKLQETEALAMVGDWGVDISSAESIETTLKENPIFEQSIRDMLGISLISDEELDEAIMLHSLNI